MLPEALGLDGAAAGASPLPEALGLDGGLTGGASPLPDLPVTAPGIGAVPAGEAAGSFAVAPMSWQHPDPAIAGA